MKNLTNQVNAILDNQIVSYGLLLIIGLAYFVPSLPYDFIRGMDDDWLVINNPGIREFSWRNIKFLFLEDHLDLHYYPLTYVSLSFDYHCFGLNPGLMRLHNILLHVVSGMLLYRISAELFSSNRIAFWIALIFIIQPMQIESVVWVICRRQVLFVFYFMLTWYLYLKYRKQDAGSLGKKLMYLLLIVGYTASLLSKATGISLPAVMVLSAFFIEKPEGIKDFKPLRWILWLLPFMVIAGGSLYMNAMADEGNFMRRSFDYSVIQHIIFVFYTLGYYIYKTILPFQLSAFYPAPQEGSGHLPYEYLLLAGVGLALVVGLVWAFKNKDHLWVFLISGYLVTIAVLTNRLLLFSDVPMLVADRYYYQSAPFVIAMVVFVLHKQWPKQFNPLLFVLVGVISMGFFSYLPKWKNVHVLIDQVLENYPSTEFYNRSAIAHALHGGDLQVAKNRLQQVKESTDGITFNNPDPFLFELGITNLMVGDTNGAKAVLSEFRTDTTLYYEYLSRSINGEVFTEVPSEFNGNASP